MHPPFPREFFDIVALDLGRTINTPADLGHDGAVLMADYLAAAFEMYDDAHRHLSTLTLWMILEGRRAGGALAVALDDRFDDTGLTGVVFGMDDPRRPWSALVLRLTDSHRPGSPPGPPG